MPDKKLLDSLKKGDLIAFDAIYERYSKRLYRFVFRYLKQPADAEEIVQEVFVKIWQSRTRIDVYSSFESFIFTIAYNASIGLLRKRLTEKKYLDHLYALQSPENEPDQADEIQFKDLNEKYRLLLGQLTPRQKEIFLLSREEGLSHEEIAKRLDISVNTVKNHMVSALSFFKTHLDNSLIAGILYFHLFIS